MNTQERFAENLRRLRKNQKPEMTQEALAKVSGISITTLQNYERCAGNPTLANIEAIANALHVSIGELLGEDVQKPVRMETYADLFSVMMQLPSMKLDAGRFINGESSGYGNIEICCDIRQDQHPDTLDRIETYQINITCEDKHLFDFISAYQKINEMLDGVTDDRTRKTLQDMRIAWENCQIEQNRSRRIHFTDDDIPF